MILCSSIKSDLASQLSRRNHQGSLGVPPECHSLRSIRHLTDTSIETRDLGLGAMAASSSSSAIQLRDGEEVPCDEGIQEFNWVTGKI